jgi:hypothetical protein
MQDGKEWVACLPWKNKEARDGGRLEGDNAVAEGKGNLKSIESG